jgi:hypothetical protein
MVDKFLHSFDETHGVRQPGVDFERSLVGPARVDVEQARVSNRAIGLNRQAARLLAGGSEDIVKRRCHSALLSLSGVEAAKNEKFHQFLPLTCQNSTLILPTAVKASPMHPLDARQITHATPHAFCYCPCRATERGSA